MKLSEIYQRRDNCRRLLNEIPYLHPGELTHIQLDSTISLSYIQREYVQLGVVGDVKVMLHRERVAVVGVPNNSDREDGRVEQIFRLTFKDRHELKFNHPFTNVLQENTVKIHKKYGGQGIMSNVYKLIAERGFTLISDSTQFESAQAMWMKMSRDPNYFIWVVDADSGFFKDEDGKIIRYVGQKLIDDQVWTTGSNYDGNYRLMILTKQDIR
jgi:hypothetical protein